MSMVSVTTFNYFWYIAKFKKDYIRYLVVITNRKDKLESLTGHHYIIIKSIN